VRKRAAEDPGVSLPALARALNASEAEVILALPPHMRIRARVADLAAIWERLEIRKDLLSCRRPGKDVFTATSLPAEAPREEELESIWFLSRPAGGEERRSLRFFAPQGKRLLVVYMDAVADDFDEMRALFGVRPVPRSRCGGCGRCACGHKSGGRAKPPPDGGALRAYG
jgi:hypothetical protein